MDGEEGGRVIVRDSWVLVQDLSLINVGSFQPTITSLMLNFLTEANELIKKDN